MYKSIQKIWRKCPRRVHSLASKHAMFWFISDRVCKHKCRYLRSKTVLVLVSSFSQSEMINRINVDWVELSTTIRLIISSYIHATYFFDEHLEKITNILRCFLENCVVWIYIPPAQSRNFRSVYTLDRWKKHHIFFMVPVYIKVWKNSCALVKSLTNKFLNENWTTFYLFFTYWNLIKNFEKIWC